MSVMTYISAHLALNNSYSLKIINTPLLVENWVATYCLYTYNHQTPLHLGTRIRVTLKETRPPGFRFGAERG
jgi:hypothetical protein